MENMCPLKFPVSHFPVTLSNCLRWKLLQIWIYSLLYSYFHSALCFFSLNLISHSSTILIPFNHGLWNPWYVAKTYTHTTHLLLCQLLLRHFSISCFNWNLLSLWHNHSMPQADVNHSPTHLISLGQEVGSQHSSHFPSWSLTITPILLGKSLAFLELRIFGSQPNILITLPQAPGTWKHHSQCFSLF